MAQSFLNTIMDTYKSIRDKIFKSGNIVDVINDNITMGNNYVIGMLKDIRDCTNSTNLRLRTVVFTVPELQQMVIMLESHTRSKPKKGFEYTIIAVENCIRYMELLLGVIEKEFDKTTSEASLDTMNYRLGHVMVELGAIRTWFKYIGTTSSMVRYAASGLIENSSFSKFEKASVLAGMDLMLTMSDKFQESPQKLLAQVMAMEPVKVTSDVANLISSRTITETNKVGFVASKVNPFFLAGMIYNAFYLWDLELMRDRHEQAQVQRRLIDQIMRDKGEAKTDSEKKEREKLIKQITYYDELIARMERKIREKMEEE